MKEERRRVSASSMVEGRGLGGGVGGRRVFEGFCERGGEGLVGLSRQTDPGI